MRFNDAALGYPMGTAYMKKNRIRDWYIGDISMISFCLPQLVSARVLTMLIPGEARVTIDLTWAQNLKRGSKVTSSIRGVLSRGSRELFRGTLGWVLDCAN